MTGIGAALAAAAVAAVLAFGGGGDRTTPPAPRPASAPARVDHFDSGRAWAELRARSSWGRGPPDRARCAGWPGG